MPCFVLCGSACIRLRLLYPLAGCLGHLPFRIQNRIYEEVATIWADWVSHNKRVGILGGLSISRL